MFSFSGRVKEESKRSFLKKRTKKLLQFQGRECCPDLRDVQKIVDKFGGSLDNGPDRSVGFPCGLGPDGGCAFGFRYCPTGCAILAGDMKTLPGQCTNEMFCTLGASARLISVPADQPFVCPTCGKRLTTAAAPRRNWRRRAGLFAILVTLLIFAGFLFGGMMAGMAFHH